MTLRLRHIGPVILSAMLLPTGLVSCSKSSDGGKSEQIIQTTPVKLALSLGSDHATKASVEVITEMKPNPEFRGLTDILVVPFASASAVEEGDKTLSTMLSLPSITSNGLISGNNAHHYTGGGLKLPLKTASALVYGKAPRESGQSVETLHKWGSLTEVGFEKKGAKESYVTYAGDLGFKPHTMLVQDSGSPAEATEIANVLSSIVNGGVYSLQVYYDFDQNGTPSNNKIVSMAWDDTIGDDNLRSCFEDVTVGGALIPGSGENVEALLTNLYRSLYNYNILNSTPYEINENGEIYQDVRWWDAHLNAYRDLTYGVLYNGVKQMLLDRFTALVPNPAEDKVGKITISEDENPVVSFISSDLSNYPEQYGLPSGAAVVRWTPNGYVVPMENGLDGIAPISYYCYPPSLYYFSNTTIRTSNDESEVAPFYNSSYTWDQIKGAYRDGRSVTSSTRAVLLEEKLQYAVSMLSATVRSASEYLQDNDGRDDTRVHATGENLPLTGVIIGRQYPLHFDFTPKFVSDTDSRQFFLYDDQVPSGIYLHYPEENETLKEFRTLVLETPRRTEQWNTEVYFALEFLNNTDSFMGAEGRILHGHKFYLVGKLDFPENTTFDQVFMRDHITTAPCVIRTLKNAHNAVPDLGAPQLTLGVELASSWVMSDAATLILGDDDGE